MTPREKADILIRVLRGEPIARLADEVGVTAHTIRDWCRVAKVPTQSRDSRIANAEQFIRVWQRATSCLEVALALNMELRSVRQRATHYRSRGVPLKRMSPSRRLDWERLAQFAEELGDGQPEES